MGLPATFLVGLLVLFTSHELMAPVTGSGRVEQLPAFLALALLPTALAVVARQVLRWRLLLARRDGLRPRWLLRASALASPLVLHLLLVPGGWLDLSSRWAGGSHLVELALLLSALLLVEVPRLVWGTVAAMWCEIEEEVAGGAPVAESMLPDLRELWPIVRLRLGWPMLVLLPCLLLGGALDLLRLDRRAYAFFLGTAPGSAMAALGFLLAMAALLPFWFRVAFGVRSTLPEPIGSILGRTAAALGFRPSRVLLLPTGMRAMNAMMVGPLPIGRFVCVTDGILRALDADSLAGVVAHEVGHARMEHPGLLMTLAVVVPLLLLHPMQYLQLGELDVAWQSAIAVATIVFVWTMVRGLAHRFEHEADVASVRALGAAPCTRALQVVSRMALPVAHGLFGRFVSLHPEESRRCQLMQRYETEPAFRQAFDATGRRLRRAVLAGLVAAFGLAVLVWLADRPYERAFWQLQSGDVAGARAQVAALGEEVPGRWRSSWSRLREDLAAAVEITPEASDWEEARSGWDDRAFARAVEVLLQAGPAAARPWFALAVEADRSGSVVRAAVYEFCRAARDADLGRMEEARAVVRRLGIPAGLEPVFRD